MDEAVLVLALSVMLALLVIDRLARQCAPHRSGRAVGPGARPEHPRLTA